MEQPARSSRLAQDHSPPRDGHWPYASLLIFGYFGQDSPGGKRLARETTAWLALAVAAMVVAGPLAYGLPVSVVGIGWSYARYLRGLDELSRMIQLKAMAVAYGAAMTIGAVAAALALASPSVGQSMRPAVVFPFLVLAEGVRGIVLVIQARRYG